jgi:hypothetical protein
MDQSSLSKRRSGFAPDSYLNGDHVRFDGAIRMAPR